MRNLMSFPAAALLMMLGVAALSCRQSAPAENSLSSDTTKADSTTTLRPGDSSLTSAAMDSFPCVRANAEPVVKNTVHPKSVFELSKDGHAGTETVDFTNGDRMIIRNQGCEYYILAFRFETSRFAADTTNTIYWMDKAVSLMSSIESSLDVPLDIPAGTAAIKNVLNGEPRYALGDELVYSDGEMREFVSVDRVQQIRTNRYAVEVTYTLGPL